MQCVVKLWSGLSIFHSSKKSPREGWCVLIWKEIPWIRLFLFRISRCHTRGRWITCPSVLAVLVANILWNGPNQLEL